MGRRGTSLFPPLRTRERSEFHGSKLDGGKKGGITAFSLSFGSRVSGAPLLSFRSKKKRRTSVTKRAHLQTNPKHTLNQKRLRIISCNCSIGTESSNRNTVDADPTSRKKSNKLCNSGWDPAGMKNVVRVCSCLLRSLF